MSFHPAAFRIGEYARIADGATLKRLQTEFPNFCLNDLNLAQYEGERVRIRNNQGLIGGSVVYQFEVIPGFWIEQAIIDLCMDQDTKSTELIYTPANETYFATPDVPDGPGLVYVRDVEQQLFFCFRDNDAVNAANAVNKIAELRVKRNFESFFGFDGVYPTFD
jgi:hypothetical protein